jgi:hypothetical protein
VAVPLGACYWLAHVTFHPAEDQHKARDKIKRYEEIISGWEAERQEAKASLPPDENPIHLDSWLENPDIHDELH